MKVVIIGGGPSGMMAAIASSKAGNQVTILEKNDRLGKKLLITGKGRCNITSSLPMEEFIKNTPGNGKFLYSCFRNYTNQDIIQFLQEQGLQVKEERGNRIFPVTDKSQDVLACFTRKIKELGIIVKYHAKVEKILVQENRVVGVKVNGKTIVANKVILATGGKSYPLAGSTGDGYELASQLGHTITPIKPSLVPFEIYDKNLASQLQGLSLRNVKIQMKDQEKEKVIYQDLGEMLFTHYGVSGPIILSGSAHCTRYKEIERLLRMKKIVLTIDLKPALSQEKLDERIKRDFEEYKNKQYKNSLVKLLPQKLIPIIIKASQIDPNKKVNEITKEERERLITLLKNITIPLKNFRPIEEAIITSGGIQVKEINPKTMESKIVQGLYFAGEIIDVDSYTGGFNLQIAYSTGYAAGIG